MTMTVEQFLRSSSSVYYYYYYFSFMKNDATQQFVVCSRFFFSQSDSSNFIEKRTTWFSSRWRLNNLYITQPNFSFWTSILGSLPSMNCEFSYIVLFWYSYVQVARYQSWYVFSKTSSKMNHYSQSTSLDSRTSSMNMIWMCYECEMNIIWM